MVFYDDLPSRGPEFPTMAEDGSEGQGGGDDGGIIGDLLTGEPVRMVMVLTVRLVIQVGTMVLVPTDWQHCLVIRYNSLQSASLAPSPIS